MKSGTKDGTCSNDMFAVRTFQVPLTRLPAPGLRAVSVFSLVAGTTLGGTERGPVSIKAPCRGESMLEIIHWLRRRPWARHQCILG